MQRKLVRRADGRVTVADVFKASERVNASKQGSDTDYSGNPSSDGSLWGSVINNVGGWLNSIGGTITGSISAKTGNYGQVQQDRTPAILAISAVAAILLVVILLIVFKKK
jgi:hypothetical protein